MIKFHIDLTLFKQRTSSCLRFKLKKRISLSQTRTIKTKFWCHVARFFRSDKKKKRVPEFSIFDEWQITQKDISQLFLSQIFPVSLSHVKNDRFYLNLELQSRFTKNGIKKSLFFISPNCSSDLLVSEEGWPKGWFQSVTWSKQPIIETITTFFLSI